jgi:peptidoglycan/LPS O-acetylase OafA/YrhL
MESSNKKYFSRLDHLRFFAAAMVLMWHVMRFNRQAPSTDVPNLWPLSFLQEGHTGVALFFVLSGYIFYALCRDRQIKYSNFLKNRILRIAPLFFFWTLLYFYIGDIDPSKLFFAIACLLNKGTVPGNGWTVIVEFQFYLLFPFLLFFNRTYGLRYLIGLLFLTMFFRWSVWFTSGTVQDLAYSTLFGRIDQFLLGIIGCELSHRYKKLFKSRLLLIVLIALWVIVFHKFDQAGGFFDNTGGYPSISSVWVYWPFVEGFFYSFITSSYIAVSFSLPNLLDKSLAWLGTVSYSLYLNQHFSILITYKIYKATGLKTTGVNNALMFGIFGVLPVLVAVSAMTYYLIERPFLRLRQPYLRTVDESKELIYTS